MQETQVPSLGWEDPWEKGMATHSSILAMDREAWWATVLGLAKSQVRLNNSTTTNVVLISGTQQSDPVIHLCASILFQVFFLYLGYYRTLNRVFCAI